MQAAAGLGGGANVQPVQEGNAEGGAAVSGCPPRPTVVYRCIVGSHKAVSVCFMFFLFFFIKPVDQPFSSFSLVTERILPPAAARKRAAPERKTGKN